MLCCFRCSDNPRNHKDQRLRFGRSDAENFVWYADNNKVVANLAADIKLCNLPLGFFKGDVRENFVTLLQRGLGQNRQV